MKTSARGIDLIKRYESIRLKAYKLAGEKYYTIGWGHTGPDVTANMTISSERADELLKLDLAKFERYVDQYVPITLSQLQYDALVSYCYNRGPGGLKQLVAASKTAEDYARNIVVYWGTATKYKNGLIRRRKEEQALFREGMPKASVHDIALEVLDGKWGNGAARKAALEAAGWNYADVQAEVNRILKGGE